MGYYMGEHSYGYISLQELSEALIPTPKPTLADRYTVEKGYDGSILIQFDDSVQDEYDSFRALQLGLSMMFGESFTYTLNGVEERCGMQNYRLVFGYDS